MKIDNIQLEQNVKQFMLYWIKLIWLFINETVI